MVGPFFYTYPKNCTSLFVDDFVGYPSITFRKDVGNVTREVAHVSLVGLPGYCPDHLPSMAGGYKGQG